MVEPAIAGTRNVMRACKKARVKKVVVVSSVAAIVLNPSWPKDRPMDEECWSDPDLCKAPEVCNDPIRVLSSLVPDFENIENIILVFFLKPILFFEFFKNRESNMFNVFFLFSLFKKKKKNSFKKP